MTTLTRSPQTCDLLRPLSLRRILVPVDFSGASRMALDLGHRLADRFGATLEVLHVRDSPPLPARDLAVGEGAAARTSDEEAMQRAARDLEAFTAHLPGSPRVTGRLLDGSPPAAILRAAEDRSVDMIVMGTHGRTGLARLLLGSVTEQVMRMARCPVLTVSQRVNEQNGHGAERA